MTIWDLVRLWAMSPLSAWLLRGGGENLRKVISASCRGSARTPEETQTFVMFPHENILGLALDQGNHFLCALRNVCGIVCAWQGKRSLITTRAKNTVFHYVVSLSIVCVCVCVDVHLSTSRANTGTLYNFPHLPYSFLVLKCSVIEISYQIQTVQCPLNKNVVLYWVCTRSRAREWMCENACLTVNISTVDECAAISVLQRIIFLSIKPATAKMNECQTMSVAGKMAVREAVFLLFLNLDLCWS